MLTLAALCHRDQHASQILAAPMRTALSAVPVNRRVIVLTEWAVIHWLDAVIINVIQMVIVLHTKHVSVSVVSIHVPALVVSVHLAKLKNTIRLVSVIMV